jgi:hypothetical protein
MSEQSKMIVLVSASPKVDQAWAVSAFLAARGEEIVRDEAIAVETIPVRHALMHRETEGAFAALQQADAIVLIFPLYFFCMPAMLTRFLQDFAVKYPKTTHAAGVYAIVNCGFPEPEINEEAMRVVECFVLQTGRSFLGGVMIGCGGMLMGAAQAPFMRPVFEKIDGLFARVKRDVLSKESEKAEIAQAAPKFPKALYFLAGNSGWRSMARKNKLKSRELFRKPYQK